MSSAGWKDIKYRQDLPPPGGYGKVPYKRNLPIKGPNALILSGLLITIHGLAYREYSKAIDHFVLIKRENKQAEICYLALLEAEKDRAHLLMHKENVESEALNIVGTGYDPDYKPGKFDVYHSDRYQYPFVGGPSTFFTKVRDWYTNRVWEPRIGP